MEEGRHYDVVIVGAGISGISAAYYMKRQCPDLTFTVLEGRSNLGGRAKVKVLLSSIAVHHHHVCVCVCVCVCVSMCVCLPACIRVCVCARACGRACVRVAHSMRGAFPFTPYFGLDLHSALTSFLHCTYPHTHTPVPIHTHLRTRARTRHMGLFQVPWYPVRL